MPGGMVGTGLGYDQSATSGMARLSQQEQQRKAANEQIADQQKAQTMQVGASAASTIGMIATMIAMAPE